MSSLINKAAQVVFPRLGSNMVPPIRVEDDLTRFKELLREYAFGGLVLFNGDLRSTPGALAELQSLSSSPLLVGSDIERGAGQQLAGATLFPHARASGRAGIEATASFAQITAREALSGGIHIAFAPVADVNTNPRNPIIGIRAFGTSPSDVSQHVETFIAGCQAQGLYATAKHFPGHGNTATDSHAELPIVPSTRTFLKQHDLMPFQRAIKAGVSSIMTAHITFPSLDPAMNPATTSRPILTDLLRNKLQFDGIIITDSLIMEGIWTRGISIADTAAQLINAGVDILLDPPDPPAMVEGIVAALESGKIREMQLDRSIERLNVLRQKIKGRFGEHAFTNPPTLEASDVDRHNGIAKEIAFNALSNDRVVTKRTPDHNTLALFVLPYKTHLDPPEQPLGTLLRTYMPGITYREIYDATPGSQLDAIETLSHSKDELLVFLVAKPAAWRAFGIPDRLRTFIDRLVIGKHTRIIAMGDPGILDFVHGEMDTICTYSDAEPSQHAIVRWLKDQ